jgi:recombination protein RecT
MVQQGRQIAKRGPEELVALIEKRQAEVETMLQGSMTFPFFKAALLQACRKTPKLLECHPASVYQAALDCAMTGLIPGGPFGEAALIPYGAECQFQPMVKGLRRLAIESGAATKISAQVVCKGEPFSYRPKAPRAEDRITHEVHLPRDEIVGAYAWATLPSGDEVEIVVDRAYLDRARAANRGKSPAWDGWFAQMAEKSVMRRLINSRLSTRDEKLLKALAADVPLEEEDESPPLAPVRGVAAMKAALKQEDEPAPEADLDAGFVAPSEDEPGANG